MATATEMTFAVIGLSPSTSAGPEPQQVEQPDVDHERDAPDHTELDHLPDQRRAARRAGGRCEASHRRSGVRRHASASSVWCRLRAFGSRMTQQRWASGVAGGWAEAVVGAGRGSGPVRRPRWIPAGGGRRRRPAGADDGAGGDRARRAPARAGRRTPTTAPPRSSPTRRSAHHTDEAAVAASPRRATSLTFDHEHVPTELLQALEAEGVAVRPGPAALVHAQDKLAMRERLAALGVRCPRVGRGRLRRGGVRGVRRRAPAGRWCVKTPRGGYDGKGVAVLGRPTTLEAPDWRRGSRSSRTGLLAEEKVDVRAASWPCWSRAARRARPRRGRWCETVQVDGVCDEVVAPAPGLDERLAAAARRPTRCGSPRELGVTGVLAVELLRDHGDGAVPRQRARDAPAQQRPLDDRRLGHQPVRAAPARGARPAARRRRAARAPWTVMANVLGGRYRRPLPVVPARDGARPGDQGAPVRQGGPPGPQGRARDGLR